MNKITKFTLLSVLGLSFASCDDEFDINRLHDEPQLLVYCFPTEGDSTVVEVFRTVPVDTKGDYSFLVDAQVTYRVNGREVPVRRITGDDCARLSVDPDKPVERLEGQYCALATQKAGDRIEVEVHADGLPTATAATTIPRKVEARIDGVVPDVKNADDYHSCNRMSATFKDDGSAKDYYMVRIAERRMAGMAVGRDREDPTVLGREFQANSYDDYLAYKNQFPYWDFSQLQWKRHYVGINTDSDPVFNSISKLDEEFGFDWYEYSGMAYFFNDQLFNGRPYTLRLDIYKDSYSSDDRYNFGLWDDYAGCYFYILQFYKLSTEYYRYIKSKNDQENSDWANSGLMSARPSYTNVRGGLGVVAGYAASSATWRVEVKPDPKIDYTNKEP